MAYGTPDEVAAKARPFSDDGRWVDPNEDYDIRGTNPTFATVTTWLENTSAQMDVALGASWFQAPVDPDTSPRAYQAIAEYVCSLVADQCYLVNGVDRQVSPTGRALKDLTDWVAKNADGLIALGLQQVPTPSVKNQASFRMLG